MEVWVPEAATVTSPSSELGHEHGFDVDPTQQVLPPSPDQTNRPKSPALLISPPSPHHPAPAPDLQEPLPHTTVSGDILLPLIIFSVVKANPPHLVSHLLYTQRFRNHSIGGEESYCLVNLLAVAEFLENVDLGALGLGGSYKVMRYVTFVTSSHLNKLTSSLLSQQHRRPNTNTNKPKPNDSRYTYSPTPSTRCLWRHPRSSRTTSRRHRRLRKQSHNRRRRLLIRDPQIVFIITH